ncbi:hypothetical protein N9F93_00535 [bacterium]|nr:hypothetical protein [bacterium]MDA8988736.1 hypothetical protein [bacterium]
MSSANRVDTLPAAFYGPKSVTGAAGGGTLGVGWSPDPRPGSPWADERALSDMAFPPCGLEQHGEVVAFLRSETHLLIARVEQVSSDGRWVARRVCTAVPLADALTRLATVVEALQVADPERIARTGQLEVTAVTRPVPTNLLVQALLVVLAPGGLDDGAQTWTLGQAVSPSDVLVVAGLLRAVHPAPGLVLGFAGRLSEVPDLGTPVSGEGRLCLHAGEGTERSIADPIPAISPAEWGVDGQRLMRLTEAEATRALEALSQLQRAIQPEDLFAVLEPHRVDYSGLSSDRALRALFARAAACPTDDLVPFAEPLLSRFEPAELLELDQLPWLDDFRSKLARALGRQLRLEPKALERLLGAEG